MIKLFGQRKSKKKSIEERKLELLGQIEYLNTGLENMKRQDFTIETMYAVPNKPDSIRFSTGCVHR